MTISQTAAAVTATTAAEIRALFAAYSEAWAANDPARLEAHWDTTDPVPVYLAEEIDSPMTDWDSLRAYWRHNEGFHEKVRLVFSEFAFKPLDDSQVMVVLHMRWDIRFRNFASEAMGGDNRVVTTVRRVGDDWRLTSWTEAPLAPITYMRRLYERSVSPDF
ncbi:MAG: nuclear transport factor 2 family protein [Gammaproteobacteria bacterium]|nr:nuclear transport factor 2 family protein [Gammaproteobacteria bacterium]